MASDDTKVFAKSAEVQFRGKSYKISPISYDLRAEFSCWLKRRAVLEIQAQLDQGWISEESYEAKMDRVDQNMAAGVYSFGGKLSLAAAKSPEGSKEILRLCLVKGNGDAKEFTSEFIDEFLQEKQKEIERALKNANSLPLAEPRPTKKK